MWNFREATAAAIWPVMLSLSLAAFALMLRADIPPATALFVATVGQFAIIVGLEFLLPARREWSVIGDRQVFNDILHGLLLDPGSRLGTIVVTNLVALAGVELADGIGAGGWPADWPLWVQVALAVLMFDFVDYAKHRLYHRVAWLWPVHALHHNPTRMHVFKGARLNVLEAVVRGAVIFGPMAILGAPAEVLIWLVALMNFVGNLNHANIETRLPEWVNAWFATPASHHLHHAVEPDLTCVNLSGFTLIPDHLFGTFRAPEAHAGHGVGLADNPIPGNFVVQFLSPFLWPRLNSRAPDNAVAGTDGKGGIHA